MSGPKKKVANEAEAHTHDETSGHVHGPNCSHGHSHAPVRRDEPKVGRNDPCTCGSGKKFKKCCGTNA